MVRVRFSRLVRVKKARQDGQGEWEGIEFYPTYNGMPGQYSYAALKTYVNEGEHGYD